MAATALAPRQLDLLDVGELPHLRGLDRARRHHLSHGAWVDVVPRAVAGGDALFEAMAQAADWQVQRMVMFEQVVTCPRLVTSWPSPTELPPSLEVLSDLAWELHDRYGVALPRITSNLYRDGDDAVAWHGDRGARDVATATVAVLSLGATRPFRLRARAGGGRLDLAPAAGDLLVMGGTCQRTWQHAVPRVATAGPRISVMFRPDGLTTPSAS